MHAVPNSRNMIRQNLLLLFMSFFFAASAQKNLYKTPDSLKHKSYDYLDDRFYKLKRDSSHASLYAYVFLHKAKKEKNLEQMINGYQNLMLISEGEIRLVYTDSMIYYAKKTNDNALIGSAYLSRGTAYYGLKQQQEAMDNYLAANIYISKTNDLYLIHKVKYCIALTKFYIGFYDEAESLFKECADYYRDKQAMPYLNALHSLGLCYNKQGDYGKCSEINARGILESKRLKTEEMVSYFNHSEGINEYFKKNYSASIKNLESSLEAMKENNDFGNEAVGYFYIGKSCWALHQKEKAIVYFQLVNRIFNDKKYLRPDLRQTFELMISYYKTKKDLHKQLYYIDQLLKADTLLTETNKYIVSKIHKQYDTKELILEKEKIKTENANINEELLWEKNYDKIFTGIIIVMSVIILVVSYRYQHIRKIYKKNYQLVMIEQRTNSNIPKVQKEKNSITNINSETIALLLKQLENFEKDKRFLEKDWNLSSLSSAFNTNHKYVAAILDQYRDKGINDYINGLRIDYIVTLLRTEPKFKHYTYEALAKEAGFSTTERFKKAFLSKNGFPPAYLIDQLKKEKF